MTAGLSAPGPARQRKRASLCPAIADGAPVLRPDHDDGGDGRIAWVRVRVWEAIFWCNGPQKYRGVKRRSQEAEAWDALEERRGGGSGAQKFVYQKWPNQTTDGK